MEKFSKPYHFKCINCGNCCKDSRTIVNLTYMDLRRMVDGLKLGIGQLFEKIGFFVFEEELNEDNKKKMILPPVTTERGPSFIGLRKDKEGKCVFLNKNNKCSIYKFRPNICRTFPFHFDAQVKNEPHDHIEIKMGVAQKAVEYCPGFSKEVPEVNKNKWLSYGKQAIKNLVEEAALIEKWNSAVSDENIEPVAENYIKMVLRFTQKDKKVYNPPEKKKSYKDIVKEKLDKNQE